MEGDFILIDRKIVKWEWYKNGNTMRLFLHCLINANWKDGRFEGLQIRRGSFVSSLPKLSEDLGMSVMEVRTALKHLKLTGELTVTSYPKFSVITVNNYNAYQWDNSLCNSQLTGEQQAINRLLTGYKEEKMKGEEKSGDEKGTKEERERTKEKEESGLKAEERKVEESKGVEGKKREKGNTNTLGEKDKEKEAPRENMIQMFKRLAAEYPLSDLLYDKLIEWFTYKQERKQIYTETGMKGLIKRVIDNSHQYSDVEVCDLIDDSISSNWSGIIWDNIGRPRGRQSLADRWRNA